MKEAMKRKKWLYSKALNDQTEESWKCYKEAKKNAKQAVLFRNPPSNRCMRQIVAEMSNEVV